MKKDGIRAAMSEQVEKDTLKRMAQRTAQNRIDGWRDEWHLEPEPELDGQNSRIYESLVAHVAEALTTARREAREEGRLEGLREADGLSCLAGAIRERIKLLEAAKKGDTDA